MINYGRFFNFQANYGSFFHFHAPCIFHIYDNIIGLVKKADFNDVAAVVPHYRYISLQSMSA